MKLKPLFFITTLVVSLPIVASEIEGNWITIDDKTGNKRAIVRLSDDKGILSGRIVKVFHHAGDTGRCTNCSGKFKDKPIKGLRFVWGLKKESDKVWDNGRILDPKSGHIYKAIITQNGNKLDVRGYIGLKAIGRSQTWIR